MNKNRPDKFKRWMIASFVLIPLVLFGITLGSYYFFTPVKMHILISLLKNHKTFFFAYGRLQGEEEKAVPYLIENLSNSDSSLRYYSVLILTALGQKGIKDEKAVEPLIKLLSDRYVQSSAACALGVLGDERAVPHLIKSLSDPNEYLRRDAAWALGALGSEEAVGDLMRLLSDPHPDVRGSAALALGYSLRVKEAGPELIRLLSDPSPEVRSQAAIALAGLQGEKAIPHLVKLLSDPEAQVRSRTALALGRLQAKEAMEALVELLSDPEDWVRISAAGALGEIGSLDAVGPLMGCLKDISENRVIHAQAQRIEDEVIWALESISGQSFGRLYYDPGAATQASDAEREQIIQKWLQWWEENKDKYEVDAESQVTETLEPEGG